MTALDTIKEVIKPLVPGLETDLYEDIDMKVELKAEQRLNGVGSWACRKGVYKCSITFKMACLSLLLFRVNNAYYYTVLNRCSFDAGVSVKRGLHLRCLLIYLLELRITNSWWYLGRVVWPEYILEMHGVSTPKFVPWSSSIPSYSSASVARHWTCKYLKASCVCEKSHLL